ncbi:hypothetical protein HAX54_009848, partial [Datura stramonium]|nr:hypothetical protein [Datura stramonium]
MSKEAEGLTCFQEGRAIVIGKERSPLQNKQLARVTTTHFQKQALKLCYYRKSEDGLTQIEPKFM